MPAAASLRATGRNIQDGFVKPVVHQAQSAAADTRHFFTHLVSPQHTLHHHALHLRCRCICVACAQMGNTERKALSLLT